MDSKMGRKRHSYDKTYEKREVKKKKRQSGQTHISSSGVEVREKTFSAVSSCCQGKCYLKIPTNKQGHLFETFYSGQGKSLQDSLLSLCM